MCRGIASDTSLSQRLSHIAKEDMEDLQKTLGHRNWLQGERRLSGKYVLQKHMWVLINLLHDFEIIKRAITTCKKYRPSITTRTVRKSYESV